MTEMRVPSTYRTLVDEALKNAKAVSADKAMLLAGNTGWLYEGYLDAPAPGNDFLSNPIAFNHTGDGHGRPLPVIVNLLRGLYRDGSGFNSPIEIVGDGLEVTVPSVVNDFHTGDSVPAGDGWNWRKAVSIPIIPHSYARFIRTRIEVRRTAGSAAAELCPVLYADPGGTTLMGRGDTVEIDSADFVLEELEIDLTKVPYERGSLLISPWYWGIRAWTPNGTTIEIRDASVTAPCIAVCSV